MTHKPDKAFLLAAGMGTRLRPYTDSLPKPMVEIGGRSIIRRAIEKLADAGVRDITVNLHHLAPVLESHLEDIKNPAIHLSHEEELLETGGGIKKALGNMRGESFYIINGDALWEDTGAPALRRLADAWNESKMDILLLLQPVGGMSLTRGVGDYTIDADGRARRAKNRDGDHMFAGIRIAHPRIFDASPDAAFSFLTLMDKAEEQGRLYALPHHGAWHHISTPEELHAVDRSFRERGIV